MSADATRRKAAEAIELSAELRPDLPAPAEEITAFEDADPATAEAIENRLSEIDIEDTQSIVTFGSSAQAELQEISRAMLTDVRNKDLGPAGDSLRDIVSTLRGFSVSELDVRNRKTWWEWMTGKAAPMARFVARYEEVDAQIDRITDNLLNHEHKLLKDIRSLDILYDRTLQFYDELGLYIAAGDEKLRRLDRETIPARRAEAEAAPQERAVIAAQDLRDLRAARDDLERRVHDLKLTRQITMQSLPSIRLVQENDKGLVTKINSTLANTVPLWETQLAQALTIRRSKEAADAVREATDLTNDLLTANAANLREANVTVRREMERGVVDIEAVRQANETLIATIEESLQITDEGRARRAAAEQDLQRLESELKDALSAARSRADGARPTKKG